MKIFKMVLVALVGMAGSRRKSDHCYGTDRIAQATKSDAMQIR